MRKVDNLLSFFFPSLSIRGRTHPELARARGCGYITCAIARTRTQYVSLVYCQFHLRLNIACCVKQCAVKFILRFFGARVEARTSICKEMHRLLLRNYSYIANQSAQSTVQHAMFKRKRNWQYGMIEGIVSRYKGCADCLLIEAARAHAVNEQWAWRMAVCDCQVENCKLQLWAARRVKILVSKS